jgi:hypothetical protein
LYQFTHINSPTSNPRSLLFAHNSEDAESDENKGRISDGYVSKNAELFIATPFDMAFILLALILPTNTKSGKSLFQPLDDLLEQHVREEKHLRYIYSHGRLHVEESMLRFCDTVEAGDEQMYRPNEEKMLGMIMQKVDNAITNGLPASLEEKFVTRKLEAPVLSVKREASALSLRHDLSIPDDNDSASESFDSQSTTASSAPSAIFSETSVVSSVSTIVPESLPDPLHDLQKRSVVLDFILSSYLPTSVAERLKERFNAKTSPINFEPLQQHLKNVAALKAEAMASRSIGDFSKKRDLEDDEVAELKTEKKRRLDEEERKRKAGESRGVRDLKKVNVSGMKKMSDFFVKKPAAKVKG